MINAEQKQGLRHLVLRVLVLRAPAALPLRTIHRLANKDRELDFVAEAADVDAALNFLAGLKHVLATNDELGAGQYWSATSEGVLYDERRQ